MALPAEKMKLGTLPPMLQQYVEYKERYPDCLLFFQVGDFYELFFQDAVTTAHEINLTLTSRDKNSENPIPMCGVPLSVADQYCDRLVQRGFSVAIVSQVGSASAGKGMVTRRLERIITPAVKVLAGAESAAATGLVAAIALRGGSEASLAFTDVQSGEIQVRDAVLVSEIPSLCGLYSISEILLPKQQGAQSLDRRTGWVRTLETLFDKKAIKFRFFDLHPTIQCQRLENFPSLSPLAKDAVVSLMTYLEEVTVEREVPVGRVVLAKELDRVAIDATTRMNLELVKNIRDGSDRGTLFEYLKYTVTPGGTRLLRNEIVAPLKNTAAIEERLSRVEVFRNTPDLRKSLRDLLSAAPDIERIGARIELEVATPRELGALRDLLGKAPSLAEQIKQFWPTLFAEKITQESLALFQKIDTLLVPEPPLVSAEGGIINVDANGELKRLSELETSSDSWLEQFEQEQRTLTSIPSLKVKYTSVFGYFIEVSNSQLAKVPSTYIRKQTTANSERFITELLKEREADILQAHDRRVMLEKDLFVELRQSLKTSIEIFKELHSAIAILDVVLALAECAFIHRLVRPSIVAEPVLEIVGGRHPQIAKILGAQFIPNNISVAGGEGVTTQGTLLITGPNMGGKSTYLRQNALIAILAQIGSFVPAERATIGITDQIFARLGAADNLSEGESTFMVEMREVSLIVRSATSQSLVLIDEIGRGTATRDGLAIAQSILEWLLVTTKARVLFATHFHELTELEPLYAASLKNFSVGSTEVEGDLIFTHRIIEGAATKSFGIEVAKMAGLPEGIIARSKELLESQPAKQKKAQLTLFSTPTKVVSEMTQQEKKVLETIKKLEPDSMTPLSALTVLTELKKLFILLVTVTLCASYVSVSYADAASTYQELKTQYLKLRNTDSHVLKEEAWRSIAKELVVISDSLPPGDAAQALFNSATAYSVLFTTLRSEDDRNEATELFLKIADDFQKEHAADQALKSLYELWQQDEPSQARGYLKRIVDEHPHSELFDFAKMQLKNGKGESPQSSHKLLTNNQHIIILDPGHGGEDFGAVGIGGLLEKDVTLAVAELVKEELNALPHFNVLMTRESDVFLPLEKRTEFANHSDGDVFISIHCNSSEKGNLNGFEIFTLDNSGDAAAKKLAERENASVDTHQQSDLSLFLSDLIQSSKAPESKQLATLIQQAVSKDIGTADDFPVRKEKQAPFYVLVGAHMPAVLVETAFINHETDGVLLSSDAFRKKIAHSISIAIQRYFSK